MDESSAYRRAGVDLDAASESLSAIEEAVTSTYDENVMAGLGAFGGLYALRDLPEGPILVASTDGVGTKTKVATATGRLDGLGEDLVNHCVNDILVQGARPLFFLDYIASSRLVPEQVAAVVASAARACRAAGVPLLGGETAEMPGVYEEGELDLVGTIVGLVARDRLVDGESVRPGDAILALASDGLHTNGFSLARAVLTGSFGERLGDSTVAEILLRPHRSYLAAVTPLLERPGLVKGMVHVTGGGLPGNLPRVLPSGQGARIETGSWPVPEIFELIASRGEVSQAEMHRVFNMGAGYLLIVDPDEVPAARELCPETLYRIGEVTEGSGVVLAR
ncbi:MAG TPA: phosphoribosylformylglycinamidine cyclo-ligase [Trueperaceae bacterium]